MPARRTLRPVLAGNRPALAAFTLRSAIGVLRPVAIEATAAVVVTTRAAIPPGAFAALALRRAAFGTALGVRTAFALTFARTLALRARTTVMEAFAIGARGTRFPLATLAILLWALAA